ncbi:MAG: peptidoglycan editing factor PgeF [Aerococcaceae bacterium]|nr:peptidoglycan editing factor PgeF [Aerococcaceae bacterium]
MNSKLLEALGLANVVAGVPYNVRTNQSVHEWSNQVQQIIAKLPIVPMECYSANQVHGNEIAYCDGMNGLDYHFGKYFLEKDGLITDQPKIALLIKYADCSPIVLFDPVKKVQAVVHSGWRSTVKRISSNAIQQMQQQFGCDVSNIVAFIGPTIDVASYQVGQEVYDAFAEFRLRDAFFVKEAGKYYLNLSEANRCILLEAGILPEKIEVSSISTYDCAALHSARRDGANYQLNALVTMMLS